MKISNSALDLYNQCPRKYKFKYIENVKGDYTATPLLFGSAIDAALNYILESIKDKKDWTEEQAEALYYQSMGKWTGQNRLEFFKNEVPEELKEHLDPDDPDHQMEVYHFILARGLKCLEVYINDVLPLIDEVISVQNKGVVLNEEGDEFVFVVDFIAKLKDGRTVLFDNKTSSAKYPKNKVITSQQLSLYIDQFPDIKYAGYIVLIKNPEKEKGMTHQIMVDVIPEETIDASFKLLDKTLLDIKEGKFPCNYKSCKAFGKPCEYERACSFGDYRGLVPAYEKKEEKPNEVKDPTHGYKSNT